jgi:hypothetical protein
MAGQRSRSENKNLRSPAKAIDVLQSFTASQLLA